MRAMRSWPSACLAFASGLALSALEGGAAMAAQVDIGSARQYWFTTPGFSLEDCDAITSDRIDHAVTWRGRRDVSALAGTEIRLKLSLRQSALYAWQFRQRKTLGRPGQRPALTGTTCGDHPCPAP